MNKNFALLFTTRIIRLFAYGFLSVVLVLYMAAIGLSAPLIGLILTATLAGDAGLSLLLTTSADRWGRRRVLIIGAILMALAGAAFLLTHDPLVLAIAAIIGVISPSGNEIGPFLPVEQAGLSQLIRSDQRTTVFAWYNLVGSFATAAGALAGGWLVQLWIAGGKTSLEAYGLIIFAYALAGVVLGLCFLALGPEIEAPPAANPARPHRLGLHKSKTIVMKLSALFALDAFAGGFVIQSFFAYWFFTQYHVDTGIIGSIFFGANILAGISALLAVPLAKKIGLIRTMVFTHIPSNVFLILVPLMPNLTGAIIVLLARFSISQMDVPTRQSYTMAVVDPDERSAAAGVTGIARSVGAALSPTLTGVLMNVPGLAGLPFILAGGLKIVYDLLLYRGFQNARPPEEQAGRT